MNGEKKMMNQPEEKPNLKIIKEHRFGDSSRDAVDLGKEIEADLKAYEELIHFESTAEGQEFLNYINQVESEPKAAAREKATAKLDDIKTRVEVLNGKQEKILEYWQEKIGK